jgi:DNA-binding LytR/AlgR family response regulator
MNVLIAEDEPLDAQRLSQLLRECEPSLTVSEQVDTVEGLVHFYQSERPVDLLLLDIQLADGLCFDAFQRTSIKTPIIFTTNHEQYAIQAFRHYNSIDYLLKPIQKRELSYALNKFKNISRAVTIGAEELRMLLQKSKSYKERFIIKAGNKLQFKQAREVAYFFADGKVCYLVTKKENRKHLIDHTLEELESSLDPTQFFRISRKFIVHIESVGEVKGLISSKLEVKLNQPCEHELSVSRDRSVAFKDWLDH